MADDWAWLDELLYGITMDEGEDDRGWWETSDGVEFGTCKLAALKVAIANRDKATWIAGWLAGARDGDGWPDPSLEAAEYAWEARQRVAGTALRATLRVICPAMSVSLSGVPLVCDLEFGHDGNHVQHTDNGTRALEWYE
jgi:hypothetical protein